MWLFEEHNVLEFLILAGDHLYRMDYERFIQAHRETDADITVAALPMDEQRATAFGLMKIDEEGRIIEFSEKPKGEQLKAMKVFFWYIQLRIMKELKFDSYLSFVFLLVPILRLILPYWVLMILEQRRCLTLRVWEYMLLANM